MTCEEGLRGMEQPITEVESCLGCSWPQAEPSTLADLTTDYGHGRTSKGTRLSIPRPRRCWSAVDYGSIINQGSRWRDSSRSCAAAAIEELSCQPAFFAGIGIG